MSAVVGLLGDIYLDRTAAGDPFAGVDLAGADVWFGNLEAPLTAAGDAAKQRRSWTDGGFKIDPAAVAHLLPLTAVSVANNHALDYGPAAYVESIEALDAAGIGHAGGGLDRKSARAAALCRANDTTVALLAYTCVFQEGWTATDDTPGMSTLRVHTSYEAPARVFEQPGWPPIVRTHADPADRNVMMQEIAAAAAAADVVVASFHWGLSTGDRAVLDYQHELGRLAVDAGANAVFGHHPHSLQPMLRYERAPIFCSLGNIVFDYDRAWRKSPSTAAIRLYIEDKRIRRIGILPLVRDSGSNPVPAARDVADQTVDFLIDGSGCEGFTRSWSGPECLIDW